MTKYLGRNGMVKKQGYKDKHTRKQNFKPEINPLVRIFSRVNRKIERELKYDGLAALMNA